LAPRAENVTIQDPSTLRALSMHGHE